jgi:hypothetical protein
VMRHTLSQTLTWALERMRTDDWSCDRIKAHLGLP